MARLVRAKELAWKQVTIADGAQRNNQPQGTCNHCGFRFTLNATRIVAHFLGLPGITTTASLCSRASMRPLCHRRGASGPAHAGVSIAAAKLGLQACNITGVNFNYVSMLCVWCVGLQRGPAMPSGCLAAPQLPSVTSRHTGPAPPRV